MNGARWCGTAFVLRVAACLVTRRRIESYVKIARKAIVVTNQPYVRKHAIPCPHPDCGALLFLAPDAPAGAYDCICHAVRITLEWRAPAPYVQPQPYLSLTETKEGKAP